MKLSFCSWGYVGLEIFAFYLGIESCYLYIMFNLNSQSICMLVQRNISWDTGPDPKLGEFD
jgi:hypothetical protein